MFHKEVISRMKEILKLGAEESTRFKYLGMSVVDEEDGRIILDQNVYTKEKWRIPLVLKEKYERELSAGEQRNYRSILGQLNWLAENTRPDLCFAVSSIGRKLKKATNYNLRRLRAEIIRLKEERCYVTLKEMKDQDMNINVFVDASFDNVGDGKP